MGVKETFGDRLRELRGDMNQEELAKKLRISRASVGYYENGARTPDIEVLEAVADCFKVSCDWLLGKAECKDAKVESIQKEIGLSEDAISFLQRFTTNVHINDASGAVLTVSGKSKPPIEISEVMCNRHFLRIIGHISFLKQIKNPSAFTEGPYKHLYEYLGEYEFYKWMSRDCEDEFRKLIEELAPYEEPESRIATQYDMDKFFF